MEDRLVFINNRGDKSSFTKEEAFKILRDDKGVVDTYRRGVIAGRVPLSWLFYGGEYLARVLPRGASEHIGKDEEGYSVWNADAYKVPLTHD